jgi:spore coat protein CotF
MNDKLIMENYLLVLKSTVEVYVHGTLESSNKEVRNLLKECLNDTMTHQADTYDEMTNFGWYSVSNVNGSTINKVLTKVNNKD